MKFLAPLTMPAFTFFLAIAGLVSAPQPALGADNERAFKIEVIAFAQHAIPSDEVLGNPASTVAWPKTVAEISRDQAFETGVRQGRKELGYLFNKLDANRDYSPFFHVAWIDTIPANRWGAAVHLHQTIDGINNPQAYSVNGYVRLQRGHYLHLQVDLVFQRPGDDRVYHLQERRRIHNHETHYFDHPAFGVIAKVSPLSAAAE